MTKHDLHPVMQEWLFCYEILRRLGFSPDELFFTVQAGGRITVRNKTKTINHPLISLTVEADGLTFLWTVGCVDASPEELKAMYQSASMFWNEAADEEWKEQEFLQSKAYEQRVELISALMAKGFCIRRQLPMSPTIH